MSEKNTLWCQECGGPLKKDSSPGVFRHKDQEGEDGHDLDADHTALPELE